MPLLFDLVVMEDVTDYITTLELKLLFADIALIKNCEHF